MAESVEARLFSSENDTLSAGARSVKYVAGGIRVNELRDNRLWTSDQVSSHFMEEGQYSVSPSFFACYAHGIQRIFIIGDLVGIYKLEEYISLHHKACMRVVERWQIFLDQLELFVQEAKVVLKRYQEAVDKLSGET